MITCIICISDFKVLCPLLTGKPITVLSLNNVHIVTLIDADSFSQKKDRIKVIAYLFKNMHYWDVFWKI